MQYLKDLIYDVCLLSPVNIRNYEFKSCVEKKKRVFFINPSAIFVQMKLNKFCAKQHKKPICSVVMIFPDEFGVISCRLAQNSALVETTFNSREKQPRKENKENWKCLF